MAVTRVAEIAAAQSSSPPVPEALMGLIGVEDLAAAAIGVSKLRAGWGLRRRRYYAMNCPEGHGVYLVSSGPKGIEGRSTWKGACTECRRAETDDLIKELPTPDWLEMSKKESP